MALHAQNGRTLSILTARGGGLTMDLTTILLEVSMIQHESTSVIPLEVKAEFQAAVRQAMSSKRDPEAMRRAAERMDRMREETYRTHGLLNLGVPAIRELRVEL